MSSQLRQIVKEYDNEYLLQQYYEKRDEYSEEAIAIMEEEIARRDIDEETLRRYRGEEQEEAKERSFSEKDFVAFDHVFSQTDMLLVNSILRDAQIPFYADNPPLSSVLPTETEASRTYTIHVHRDFVDQAHELLDTHFVKENGAYRLRHTDTKDRLKALNFFEISLSPKELEEEVEVSLSPSEADAIRGYAGRLLQEADTVEKELERPIFYYDNLEELSERLSSAGETRLRKMDLLTIVEILQVYCEDPRFPTFLNDVADALLDVFG